MTEMEPATLSTSEEKTGLPEPKTPEQIAKDLIQKGEFRRFFFSDYDGGRVWHENLLLVKGDKLDDLIECQRRSYISFDRIIETGQNKLSMYQLIDRRIKGLRFILRISRKRQKAIHLDSFTELMKIFLSTGQIKTYTRFKMLGFKYAMEHHLYMLTKIEDSYYQKKIDNALKTVIFYLERESLSKSIPAKFPEKILSKKRDKKIFEGCLKLVRYIIKMAVEDSVKIDYDSAAKIFTIIKLMKPWVKLLYQNGEEKYRQFKKSINHEYMNIYDVYKIVATQGHYYTGSSYGYYRTRGLNKKKIGFATIIKCLIKSKEEFNDGVSNPFERMFVALYSNNFVSIYFKIKNKFIKNIIIKRIDIGDGLNSTIDNCCLNRIGYSSTALSYHKLKKFIRIVFTKITNKNAQSTFINYLFIYFNKRLNKVEDMYIFEKATTDLYEETRNKSFISYLKTFYQIPYVYVDSKVIPLMMFNKHNIDNPVSYIQDRVFSELRNFNVNDIGRLMKEFISKISIFPELIVNIFIARFKKHCRPEDIPAIIKLYDKLYLENPENIDKDLITRKLVSKLKDNNKYIRSREKNPNNTIIPINIDLKKALRQKIQNKTNYTLQMDIDKLFKFLLDRDSPSTSKFAKKGRGTTWKHINYIKSLLVNLEKISLKRKKLLPINIIKDRIYIIDFFIYKAVSLIYELKMKNKLAKNLGSDEDTVRNKNKKLMECAGRLYKFGTTSPIFMKLIHFHFTLNLLKAFIVSDTTIGKKANDMLSSFKEYFSGLYCPNLIELFLKMIIYKSLSRGMHTIDKNSIEICKFVQINPGFNIEVVEELENDIKMIMPEFDLELLKDEFYLVLNNNTLIDNKDLINFDINNYTNLLKKPDIYFSQYNQN